MSKVIVLGIDAFSPELSEELMRQGQLPNFSKIKNGGSYKRLGTSNPSQSPVVWSSIATGSNPGYHGVFDFISRNPQNYLPHLSILKPNTGNILGRRSSMFNSARQGLPFWSTCSQNGIPATVIKWPVTFPPENVSGSMLSGLGVPDLRNTLGRYTLYTTVNTEQEDRKGDVIKISVKNNAVETFIIGPNKLKIPIKILINSENDGIVLEIEKKQYSLKEEEWSDWVDLKFQLGLGKHFSGIAKFFLVSLKPEINLYLSSIHADPRDPAFIISYPDSYAENLASHIGVYHTLGMPGETNGLIDNCFSESAFVQLIEELITEKEKMLLYELDRFQDGLFSFVFDSVDQLQHFFWDSPIKQYQEIIKKYYRKMDEIVGKVLRVVDENTLLIIISDHGFASFRRAINLNSWFRQQGLMTLKNSAVGEPLFENVDWQKTKTYALGFSSIYLNLRGREKQGIVEPGHEAEFLKRDISAELEKLSDPKTGEAAIASVYASNEIYHGPYCHKAPDLIVGTRPGYRFSWQTAIGGAPQEIFKDNLKKWNSDHLCDPAYVPGVLFINKKISKEFPNVLDIAPTVLKYFQISKTSEIDGNALL